MREPSFITTSGLSQQDLWGQLARLSPAWSQADWTKGAKAAPEPVVAVDHGFKEGELTEAYVQTLGTECMAELLIAEQMKVDPSVSTDRKVEQMGKVRVAMGGWFISKRAAASMLQHRIIGI